MKKTLVATLAVAFAASAAFAADSGYYATKADYRNGVVTPGTAPSNQGTLGGNDDCPGQAVASLPFSDSGTTLGGNNTVGTVPIACNGLYTSVAGPDKIYALTFGAGGNFTFTVDPTGANWDTSIYVTTTCGNGATCPAGYGADDTLSNGTEVVGPISPSAGTYFFYVDSFYSTGALSAGTYDLTITGALPVELIEFGVE